jgi:sarcosine oxidase
MPSYDIIVLGLGGFGAAASCHAARRGAAVLGLEQFTPAHDRGSSHGETRIIRQAYLEHPDYVPLLIKAYEAWRDLERLTGRRLFTPQGLIISGLPDGGAVSGTAFAAKQHGLPLERLTGIETERRFPGFRIPPSHEVVFEANAGYLAAEECTRSHLDVAKRHGADLRFQTPVIFWTSDGRLVKVRTEGDEFTAKTLIIAAGAWASQCLEDLQMPLEVRRKFVGWFAVRPEFVESARSAPCFCFEIGPKFFYGFPSLDGTSMKMAEHLGGQTVADPSRVDRGRTEEDVALLTGFIRDCLPMAEPILLRHSVCLYTLTPDRHFIVDRHPHFENVILACGFSGHGYKFTSVLGDVLVDLALTGTTSAPIGFLSLDRPTLKSSRS